MPEREVLNLSAGEKPRFFYGWFVVPVAWFIMVIIWGTYYTFGVFFEPVLTEFGWSRAMTAGAFSVCALLTGLITIIAGRLTDRFGPRIVLSACGLFLGLGYLLMSQISAVWQLYLFYGVMVAVGMSGALLPLQSTVARWFVKRRGTMTGIVLTGIGMGTVIVPPLASRLISAYGWHTAYIIVGGIALVFIISAAQFIKRDPEQMGQLPYGGTQLEEQKANLNSGGFSLKQAIRTMQFWIICMLNFCFVFSLYTVMVHIAAHAVKLGASEVVAASTLAVIGGVSIIGRPAVGAFADRAGGKWAMIVCFTLLAVNFLWLTVTQEVWAIFLFAAIFGFAYGGISALFSPIIAERFGLSSHGVIFGISLFCGHIGGAIGPFIAGHICDVTDSYQIAFLVCVAVGILGIILASLLKPSVSKGGEGDSRRST